jgi:hypothetical protein
MLVSAVVTHNDGAALHTRPRPQAAASSAATPGGRHNTSTTVLQSLSALTIQQCDTATATCTITGHVSHECVARTASDRRRRPQHTRNATLLSHCNAAVRPAPIIARVTQNSARLQATHAIPRTQTQHTRNPRTSLTATTTAHCANITARTPLHAHHCTNAAHNTAHSSAHLTPCPQENTPSYSDASTAHTEEP